MNSQLCSKRLDPGAWGPQTDADFSATTEVGVQEKGRSNRSDKWQLRALET